MEDIDVIESSEKEEDIETGEFAEETEEEALSFDDVVSFTMLIETAVIFISILIFFFFFVIFF